MVCSFSPDSAGSVVLSERKLCATLSLYPHYLANDDSNARKRPFVDARKDMAHVLSDIASIASAQRSRS